MSNSSREHRPLLREDISDEECQYEIGSPLRRHMGYRGKAKNSIKGAAAIIKNWPDHWSSSVTYWWIGIAMFALTSFIFYNSVVAYSFLPAADTIPAPIIVTRNKIDIIEQKMYLPKVFMHVIVNNEKEADLNKYLPYIEIVADKYLHYKFNLIIILNDTFHNEQAVHQAEMNNEDAMNSLWADPNVLKSHRAASKSKTNINIKYVNLSSYLDDSPLRQFWKKLPYQFLEFLVRAVSIWDKGGIAFSPIILTPKSPDGIYIEKLYSLLSSYEAKKLNATTNDNHKIQNTETPKISNDHKRKHKKKVNNIRDIIDALEADAVSTQSQPEALSEAETRQELTKLEITPMKIKLNGLSNNDNVEQTTGTGYIHEYSHDGKNTNSTEVNTANRSIVNNQADIFNIMLPSFLDFLFHDKPKTTIQKENSLNRTTTRDSIKRSTRAASSESTENNNNNEGNLLQPMIISAPKSFERTDTKAEANSTPINDDLENLTIDLKGNILATKSPCHAFLGTIFSNVEHRTDNESVKDFIISELSLFCNGLLSTCKGVDVILL